MASRINTRSSTSTTTAAGAAAAAAKKSLSILGLRVNNENITLPPMPGKKGLANGGTGLKDASNKLQGLGGVGGGIKRKADNVVLDTTNTKKRSVLGDVTNAIEKTLLSHHNNTVTKKEAQQAKLAAASAALQQHKKIRTTAASTITTATVASLITRATVSTAAKTRVLAPTTGRLASVTQLPTVKVASPSTSTTTKSVLSLTEEQLAADASYCDALPSSQELKLSLDSSNYVTASEASPVVGRMEKLLLESVVEESDEATATAVKQAAEAEAAQLSKQTKKKQPPADVDDYDKECEADPFAVALYAQDIFDYYRERESKFVIDKYLDRQPEISKSMRSILVDWMVEVQESFELNHETLYLAVKLVDLFLSKAVILRDQLQLVGSTALFIACKFDERVPPYVDDFLYICDDAYRRKELIAFEIKMLKTVGFDLGIPLSYRYLRRYARCAKVSMEELTLARYILELSLMEYELLDASDASVAAAALLLARIMLPSPTAAAAAGSASKPPHPWTPTLQYYSGLEASDVLHLVHALHTMLVQPPREHLKTVRNKYSHEVFYGVAKIPVPETINL